MSTLIEAHCDLIEVVAEAIGEDQVAEPLPAQRRASGSVRKTGNGADHRAHDFGPYSTIQGRFGGLPDLSTTGPLVA